MPLSSGVGGQVRGLPPESYDESDADEERQEFCERLGRLDAVESQEPRQDQNEGQKEEPLTQAREKGRDAGASQDLIGHVRDHAHRNDRRDETLKNERFHADLHDGRVFRAEKRHHFLGEHEAQNPQNRHQAGRHRKRRVHGLEDAVVRFAPQL